jgi:hypothetical protein
MAAYGLMAGMSQSSVPAPRSIEARLKKIGEYFCQQVIAGTVEQLKDSSNVPDVVRVGQNLPKVLANMRLALLQGYTVDVSEGEPNQPFDERVTHCVFIRCDNDAICLRMGYDTMRDCFHIIGYCGANRRTPPSAKK